MTADTERARAWGRFTLDGSDEVETRTRAVVAQVADVVAHALLPREYEALVLIGGYGRGEGGVETREDGSEAPHNNLDFMLVVRGRDAARTARDRLDPLLQGVARAHGLGVDLGLVSRRALLHAPCLVMWYDMRFGHKTVLGDAQFVPSLTQFTVERVVPSDVRNLLTNRGTLLLINDELVAQRRRAGTELDLIDRKTIVKHAVKAIIGYGDALLYARGAYHWSYAEKRRRMQARSDVPAAFRALYDQAMAFRFRPDYGAYLARDLGTWVEEMKTGLADVHALTEAARLGDGALDRAFRGYLERALIAALAEQPTSARATARKLRNALRAPPAVPHLSPLARLGLRCAGPRGTLPLLFPAVAYDGVEARLRAQARAALLAPDDARAALRRAYLAQWAAVGDPNFPHVLERLGISLEPGAFGPRSPHAPNGRASHHGTTPA